MKKFTILLVLLFMGSAVFAENRVIRTYQPLPYNYHPHCHGCNNDYYYNNYYNRNRPYFNNAYHRPYARYRNAGYYPRQNVFNRVFNNGVFRRTNSSPTQNALERFRSDVNSGIVNVANIKPLKSNNPKLAQLENLVFGKDYQHQDLNLRLNRLEKSMFKKTFPQMNADERLDNLFANYNNQIKSVSPTIVSDLEKCVWGRSYGAEPLENRVSKLEEEVLGAIQQGEISDRISTLQNALSAKLKENYPISSPYGTCYGGYIPDQYSYDPNMISDFNGGNGFGRFMNNLGLIFGGGCPTGWSPQLTPYGQSNYALQNDGDYEGYVGSNGYAYQNKRRGSGMGIQILD